MLKFIVPITIFTSLAVAGNALAATPQAPIALQDANEVAAEVQSYLESQAANYPGSPQVVVDTPRVTKQAQCDQLQVFLPSGQRLRSRMTVGVRCVAPEDWSLYVQANLSIQGFYYVANRNIEVGDVLSMDDMGAREGDVLRLSRGVVFDPSQAVGYVASQRIGAGGPIKSTALRDPNSIQRGQTVRTEARGTGFVATGEGQALQSGVPGTQIQVRSTSGQIVSGTVINSNTVQVIM